MSGPPPTLGRALRAVADGEPTERHDAALEFARGHGLTVRRKGRWALTTAGKAAVPPEPGAPVELDAEAGVVAARLRPQPASPSPTGKPRPDA